MNKLTMKLYPQFQQKVQNTKIRNKKHNSLISNNLIGYLIITLFGDFFQFFKS